MGFPIFSFLLSNDIEGDYPISEPGGWDESVLKLERNEKYHSLVEFYEQPLTFYGSDGLHDGGLDYIRNIENTQGVDADIELTIAVDFGDGTEILFKGLLDLSQLKEIDAYKADIPVVKDDFWTRFIVRSSTPVDLQSTTSIDGNEVEVIDPLNVTLTPQKVNLTYEGILDKTAGFPGLDGVIITGSDTYVQTDWNIEVLDEIEEKYSLPIASNPQIPSEIFKLKFAGDYTFNITIDIADVSLQGIDVYPSTYLEWYFQIDDDTPVAFTKTNIITVFAPLRTRYTYSGTVNAAQPGSLIRIYGVRSNSNHFYVTYQRFDSIESIDLLNKISVVGETVYDETETDSMLLHDVAESIVSRSSETSIYSEYLGGQLVTTNETYDSDGCAYPFTLMQGLQIRQYLFSEKPFSMSFDDFWNGVDPIFCLGLGYEELSPKVQFLNRYFDTSISQWEQFTSSGTLQAFQYETGGYALADGSISNLPNTARFGQGQYFGWPAGDYRVKIKAYNNSTGGSSPFVSGLIIWASNVAIGNGSSTSITYTGNGDWAVGDDDTRFYDFTLAQDWDYLAFAWNKQGSGSGYDCYIRIDLIEIVQYRIRIEQRDHFFDKSSNSVNLSYVDNIERSYATDKIYKKIDIGYQKWESENISGIDDPQTKHTYSAGFRKVGEEIELYSKFIAASYAIESTRRQVIEKSKDYKLDNDTFILAINPDASPVVPELDEYFITVSNLNNPETRYNLRITPYWNFVNWRQWFSGSFTPLLEANWTFQEGEGNYDVSYDPIGGCLVNFPSVNHSENANINIDNLDVVGSTFKLKVIDFEHPLSWSDYKTIRQNMEKTIGVSETNTGHESYFILSLEYQITRGKAKFKLLKAGDEQTFIYFCYAELIETVTGTPEWDISFNVGVDGITFNMIGTSTQSGETEALISTVIGVVNKVTNSGIVQSDGSVLFYKNSILVHTEPFTNGDEVGVDFDNTYTYLDCFPGDEFKILVFESSGSPP